MRNMLAGAGIGLLMVAGTGAQALPTAAPPDRDSGVTLVYGGCGPYGHRGPYGDCQSGGQLGGTLPGGYQISCPPGYRLGRAGRACWPMRGWRRW